MKGSMLGKLGAALPTSWKWLVVVLVVVAAPLIVRAQQGQTPAQQPTKQKPRTTQERGRESTPQGQAQEAGTSGGQANPSASNAGVQWALPNKDYGNTRYSELNQITTANVGGLRLAWTFNTGTLHGHEGTPLVVNNTMYLVTPFPDFLYALDLTARPAPTLKWTYKPDPSPQAVGIACCDVVNRGITYDNGRIFENLLDGNAVAVDAATGKEVWRTRVASMNLGETTTMAPYVVKGKVFVGNSGGEMGVTGWLAALDEGSGKLLWRAYSTGPDSLVKIGADYHPYYPWMKGKDLGVRTWPPQGWKHGAGAVWGWLAYDPQLDLIYYGTSNPGPWMQEMRPGLNLFTSTIFARKPEDGSAVWAYQASQHDEWDYDAVNEDILVDLPIGGQARHVLVTFHRNGYAYVIDRATGQVLQATNYGHQNWSTGFDLRNGHPIVDVAKTTHIGRWTYDICPTDIGVKDFEPAAYSPRTHLFYVPVQNICMDYKGRQVSYIAGTPYWGADMKRHVGPGGNYGEFKAFDPVTGRTAWDIKEPFLVYSGILVTAGDVAFYGTVDGWFRAVDARSGRVLWQFKCGSGIISNPMTYIGPDGHQYVAVVDGVGGAARVTADMPGFPPQGGTLYVFAL